MSTVQEKAEEFETKLKDQATAIAEETHDRLIQGRDALMSWEHTMEHHVRTNRGIYTAVLVGLAGLIAAKLLIDRFYEKKEHILD